MYSVSAQFQLNTGDNHMSSPAAIKNGVRPHLGCSSALEFGEPGLYPLSQAGRLFCIYLVLFSVNVVRSKQMSRKKKNIDVKVNVSQYEWKFFDLFPTLETGFTCSILSFTVRHILKHNLFILNKTHYFFTDLTARLSWINWENLGVNPNRRNSSMLTALSFSDSGNN